MKRVRNGETTIDGKRSEVASIWCVVNFINTLTDEREESNLRNLLNLIVNLFRHMSRLTYREILDLFPVRIKLEDGVKYFGASHKYFDNGDFYAAFESLGNGGIFALSLCGIYLVDENDEITNFAAEIGDNLMKYAANCHNDELHLFYCTLIYIAGTLYNQY